jgi:hypothetical protein
MTLSCHPEDELPDEELEPRPEPETLSLEPGSYQWALPEGLEVPPDELRARLDFYHNSIVLFLLDNEKGIITTRLISTRDVALAFVHEFPLMSGLLPKSALWWSHGKAGEEVALWRPGRVWPVALQTEPFQPPRRIKLPMPGLIFVCSPGRPPNVYAAKRRPTSIEDVIYHAPLFNVFIDGGTCPGTHQYPDDIKELPESFFTSFFTREAHLQGRSKYPDDLMSLWEELDGEKRYPLDDLMPFGKVKDIMK